ncbi:hypothetical protein B0H34DRAFT_489316 [Crassisporium funariophilum]|nr:hypothetical protein B0H34DRAFT_489316 [Crassisporium funariophilum]
MLLVLVTGIVNKKVKRLPTWYSFCFSWFLSCLSYSMLFLAGQQTSTHPSYPLCFAQAALLYALPATVACTTFALLVQILLCFPDSVSGTPRHTKTSISCLLLVGPYTIFLLIFTGIALYQSQYPGTLQKAERGTYCISTNPAWIQISYAVVGITSLVTIFVQGYLAVRLYSNPKAVTRNGHSVATTMRGLMFSFIGLATLIIALIFTITGQSTMLLDIVLATFPVLALLVFGTQKDLFQAWFHWKGSSSVSEGRGSVFFGREVVK